LHEATMTGTEWSKGSIPQRLGPPPRTNGEETLVVIGYGALGEFVPLHHYSLANQGQDNALRG
jgi:glycerate dehydrogenase